MLALGRALMSAPRLLMLDEPSLGLAPLIVRDILRNVAACAMPASPSCWSSRMRARRLKSPITAMCWKPAKSCWTAKPQACSATLAGAGELSRRRALTAMASRIAGYDGVAVAVPVTVPYERFSIRGAHWFMARALKRLVDGAGISKDEIDGLCVASFTLAPDSAVGLTQHLGLSPRWLDHIPMGGASGDRQPAPRGARGSGGRRRDRRLHRRRHQPDRQFSPQAPRASACSRRTRSIPMAPADRTAVSRSSPPITCAPMARSREDFGKLCVAQRTNALRNPNALFKKPLTLDEYLGARLVADPLRLFDCVMPCAGAEAFLVMQRGTRAAARAAACAPRRRHRAAQRLPRRSRAAPRRLGDGPRSTCTSAGIGPADIDVLEAYDDYPVICVFQIEDLGFCAKGEGPRLHPPPQFRGERQLSLSTRRAGNCRSARPAPPAARSGSSRRSGKSRDSARRAGRGMRVMRWSPDSA